MSWLDIILIFAVVAGAGLGYKSGLVWQVIRLLSWIVSFWAAGRFYVAFGGRVNAFTGINLPPLASYLIILISILLVFYLIAYICRSVVDAIHLKLFDRISGLFLGALKVCIIATVAVVFIHFRTEPDSFFNNAISGSALASRITDVAERL